MLTNQLRRRAVPEETSLLAMRVNPKLLSLVRSAQRPQPITTP
jgi:hypothetical protein